jgi:ATP-dependent exoDNAse (exonuclease V) alpha subunit
MKYKKNMFVKHLNKPDWGNGTVVHIDGKYVTVEFEADNENRARVFPLNNEFLTFSQDGYEVTSEFKRIERLIEEKAPLIFVSGRAGTGKSELIKHMCRTLEKNIVVVAPTGLAALNVKGATIHSFFKLPPTVISPKYVRLQQDKRLYKNIGLLIVDEVSMVRADVFDAMDRFLRVNGKNQELPFGGVPVLLVGDLYQLPPVVTRDEKDALSGYETEYFYSADVYKRMKIEYIELTKIFRQKDPVFMDVLNKVRTCKELETILPNLNKTCLDKKESVAEITLTAKNDDADAINERELMKLNGELSVYDGEILGEFLKDVDNYPAPLTLRLKEGAKVMFTKNDEGKQWVNGTVGVVKDMESDSVQVQLGLEQGGKTLWVQRAEWDKYKYVYDEKEKRIITKSVGKYKQYPLILAWAITIHKGQAEIFKPNETVTHVNLV